LLAICQRDLIALNTAGKRDLGVVALLGLSAAETVTKEIPDERIHLAFGKLTECVYEMLEDSRKQKIERFLKLTQLAKAGKQSAKAERDERRLSILLTYCKPNSFDMQRGKWPEAAKAARCSVPTGHKLLKQRKEARGKFP